MIGIDGNTWLVYEGSGNYGHGLWPTPVVTIATIIAEPADWEKLPASPRLDDAKLVFREDSFDPVSRLRRGRLYQWTDGSLKEIWHFPPHPAEPNDRHSMTTDGLLHRTLYTYRPVQNIALGQSGARQLLLALGTKTAPTVWRLIAVEAIASGESMITLQARSFFGVLPELIDDAMPQTAHKDINRVIEQVSYAVFRSGAASLVDLCRAAITVVLAHWLSHSGEVPDNVHHLDVGELLKLLTKRHPGPSEHSALKAAIQLIQRFHSRGKPNEQSRYGTRPLTEEDAQLALSALGFVLQEIGWAR